MGLSQTASSTCPHGFCLVRVGNLSYASAEVNSDNESRQRFFSRYMVETDHSICGYLRISYSNMVASSVWIGLSLWKLWPCCTSSTPLSYHLSNR